MVKKTANFVVTFCGLQSNKMAAELKDKMAYNVDAETVVTISYGWSSPCVFINYIWLDQLSNTTNLWWLDAYYIVINYMFRRLWSSSC